MSAKYQGCPRWRNKMHYFIHWAKEHLYWCKNYKEEYNSKEYIGISKHKK